VARVLGAVAVVGSAYALIGQYGGAPSWWLAGSGERMPLSATFEDKTGFVLVYNADGEMATRDHAFFSPEGTNGRACITCHQLSNGMSVTTEKLQERWGETAGGDPVFAAVDGSNCPTLPQDQRESHSLLLDRGLFRIFQPFPAAGVTPDFTVEVVRDPTGCNTSARYGLKAATPMISVFRRPRMVGNMKYLADGNAFTADSRNTTLEAQAIDAVHTHEQGRNLSAEDLKQIVDFERQLYVSQGFDNKAGDLTEVGGPQGLGAWQLGRGNVSHTGDAKFLTVSRWTGGNREQAAFRASVERGSAVFSQRQFTIDQTANLEGAHAQAAKQGTCATCHSERMTGANTKQAWMDIGTSTLPWSGDDKSLPLFKITCSANAEPHPYLGRVIYTNDPGRALVTGKCRDVGSVVMQQLRGLSARAPYFTGGSAKNLQAVVDYYDRRFNAHYTAQEKQDLVNFLGVL